MPTREAMEGCESSAWEKLLESLVEMRAEAKEGRGEGEGDDEGKRALSESGKGQLGRLDRRRKKDTAHPI